MAINDTGTLRVAPKQGACTGACTDSAHQRRYLIEIARPDGSVDRRVAIGGVRGWL